MRRRHNPTNDANTARTKRHAGPTFGHLCRFFVCGIGEVNRQQLLIQVAYLSQKSDGAFAISLDDLLRFPIPDVLATEERYFITEASNNDASIRLNQSDESSMDRIS